MLDALAKKPLPEWMASATTDMSVPWRELLKESLYYPSCGIDGRPVQYFGGHCHSFVYADYGYPFESIYTLLTQEAAFFGYRLKSSRRLEDSEVDLVSAWQSIHLDPRIDGNPNQFRDRHVSPYAFWCIFERLDEISDEHGPLLFSLLYLGMDGVAAFHALYIARQVSPAVVAIIQPGEGFGWNWTHFFDTKQIFCRTVMGNSAGLPRYLLIGGNGINLSRQKELLWPGYSGPIRFWKSTNGYLGLWGHGILE